MDKLAAMRTFVAIVDGGSLTAAARSLARLEDALGARLLHRTTRRMSLTPEGAAYVDRCRQILADVREAEDALTHHGHALRGRVRITAPIRYGQLRVMPAIRAFMKAHPAVTVEARLQDHVVDLVADGIDLGVRIAMLTDTSMVATRVDSVRPVVVASPALLAQTGEPEHPRALTDLPVVHFEGGSERHWHFVVDGHREAVPVHGRLRCNLAAVGVDACVDGLGFGRFLSYQVEAQVAAGELQIVLPAFEPPPIPVHVVFPHRRLMSARVRAVIDALKAHLRGDHTPES
jgi:DNA-binding transcriptional LysR family regulator